MNFLYFCLIAIVGGYPTALVFDLLRMPSTLVFLPVELVLNWVSEPLGAFAKNAFSNMVRLGGLLLVLMFVLDYLGLGDGYKYATALLWLLLTSIAHARASVDILFELDQVSATTERREVMSWAVLGGYLGLALGLIIGLVGWKGPL